MFTLCSAGRARRRLSACPLELDVDAERADFLDEHVEGFGHARVHLVIAVHDVLVHLGAARHVVRLDRQHLLQRVRSAVRLERPDFHLAEALAAELRLAAERLLRDEAVRARRARVHLVVDEMVQLQHVHVADRDRTIEALAGAAVGQRRLTALGQVGETQHVLDLRLGRAVEHRRRDRHAVAQVARERDDLVVVAAREVLLAPAARCRSASRKPRSSAAWRCSSSIWPILMPRPFAAQPRCVSRICPMFMRDGTPSGFSTMSTGVPFGHERHVLDRHDRRDHALVAVAAGHLVAGLHAALHREIDLDHLEHAGGEIVAGGDLDALLLEAALELLALRTHALGRELERGVRVLVLEPHFEPLLARHVGEVVGFVIFAPALSLRGPRLGDLAQQHRLHALEEVLLEDALLVVEVLAHLVDLGLLDRERTRILLDAVAREHAHVDHGAVHAGRHAQRACPSRRTPSRRRSRAAASLPA